MEPIVTFEPVAPADLHTFWPEVLPGLFKLHQRRHTDWWPEDVYAAIKNGTAQLLRGLVQQDDRRFVGGFVVLVPQTDPYTNRKLLLVWIAVILPAHKGLLKPSIQALKELARRGGFDRLVLYSSRRGWERFPGFVRGDTRFELAL